jgi:hypothetical protein
VGDTGVARTVRVMSGVTVSLVGAIAMLCG